METLKTIIDRCQSFLMEEPRRHWVGIRNVDGVEALLFYNRGENSEGVCLQFISDEYCYCFSDDRARWVEISHGRGLHTVPTRQPVDL